MAIKKLLTGAALFWCALFIAAPVFAQVSSADLVLDNGDFENCPHGVFTPNNSPTKFTYGGGGVAPLPVMECRSDGTREDFPKIPAALGGRANTGHMAVYANNSLAGNSWSFIFSNVGGMKVSPGETITLDTFYRSSGFVAGAEHIEIKLEFQDASGAAIPAAAGGVIVPLPANCPGANGILPPVWNAGFITPVNGVPNSCRVTGPAPANAATVLATLVSARDGAGAAGEVIFDSFKINSSDSFAVNIGANRDTVEPGQPFVVSGVVNNNRSIPVKDVELVGEMPAGLKFVSRSTTVNGKPVQERNGSIVINMGEVSFGTPGNFAFTMMSTQGVQVGNSYEIILTARDASNGQKLAQSNRLVIRISPNPFFDLGTILGKVFNDLNENGVQDKGEEGIPMVRLVTEQGMVITTDQDGKYHIPAVKPGQHLVKIDRRTLPAGTKFITEEAYIVKITPGLPAKASFAVKMPEDTAPQALKDALKFRVVPEDNNAEPILNIQIENPVVYVAHEQMKTPIRFIMKTNFGAIIHHWKIEVRDAVGGVVWTGIGEGAPPNEVVWDGRDNQGHLLNGDETYSYRLMVADANFREDWTDLAVFRTVSMQVGEEYYPGLELPESGYFKMARYGKRDIAHDSYHSVKVVGKVLKDPETTELHINDEAIDIRQDGTFIYDAYLPSGKNDIMINTTSEEGDQLTYAESVSLKSTSFLVAALGEGSFSFDNFNGNQGTVANNQKWDAFDPDGRMAVYSNMRWKDWLRVTTSFDSKRLNRNVLFTNLNPFHLYQTYGDDSTISYEAYDTQDHFFVQADADKSFLRWGNFNTAFDDFELAQFNRTLSGLKVHYESPKTTVYGEPKADLTGFQATARQLPDHMEFRGTGGSLYYLRNINIVEGSEKIKVQVRDQITNMVLQEKDLFSGTDYDINYQEARVILSKPLSSVIDSDLVISNLINDGNEIFLVVDYEYEPPAGAFVDGLKGTTRGIKGHVAFGDKINIRLGGIYVEDKTLVVENGAKIRGISAEMKAFFNTRIRAEIAEQNSLMTDNEYSYDGGLSQINMSLAKPLDWERDRAYSIKAESKPLKKLDLSGYYQVVEPFFSNSEIISQRGTKKYGFDAQYHLMSNWALRMRYDDQNKVRAKQPNVIPDPLRSPYFLDADRIKTFTFQSINEWKRLAMTTEYRYQDIQNRSLPNMNIFDELVDQYANFEHGVGARVSYKLSDRFTPYMRGQAGIGGAGKNNQIGVGLKSQLTDRMSGFVEETIGNIGDGTRLGFESRVSDDTTVYSTFGVENSKSLQDKIFRSTAGTATDFADRHRVYTERQLTNYRSGQIFSDIAGYRPQWSENFYTDFRFERANVDTGVNYIDRNVGSLQFGYNFLEKLSTKSLFEVRYDRGVAANTERVLQWVYKGDFNWKINKNLTHQSRLEFSRSWDAQSKNTLGRFLEFGSGFAYRPLDNDKLNMLLNYTYLQVLPLDIQYSTIYAPSSNYYFGVPTEERSHTVSAEGIYDINRWFALVQKGAVKRYWIDSTETDPVALLKTLWINRINFHVTRKWDFGLEYRLLFSRETPDTNRQGILVELDREIFEYVRFGAGFNFTDFSDDLTHGDNYNARGFFIRATGKF